MTDAPILFIPGPTQVRPEVLAAQAVPMISHRGAPMKQLLADVLPGVRAAFGTTGDVVVLTSSSTGAMEAVGRSVVRPGRKAIHLTNGNFSNLWFRLSTACGLDAVEEARPWGDAWDEASAAAVLANHADVDAVFVCHSETSTGALSDLAGVAAAVRATHPDAVVCADVTSSACGVAIDFDAAGLDVAVGGVQKCWALPAGLALAACSPRAKARMADNPGRGYTNDLLSALEYQDSKGMTTTTPALGVMQALRRQIADIEETGGMAARFARHLEMQALVLDWAAERGFEPLAREGFRSPSVTSLATGGRFVVKDLVAGYAEAGYFVGGGYGKTKETHWRIGHMGDHTPEEVAELLQVTDAVLDRLGVAAGA